MNTYNLQIIDEIYGVELVSEENLTAEEVVYLLETLEERGVLYVSIIKKNNKLISYEEVLMSAK